MTRHPLRLLVLAVTLAALAVTMTAPVVVAKGGGNSPNAKACQKGGWANWFETDGTPFNNQDECVSYAAAGYTLVQGGSVSISAGEVGDSFQRSGFPVGLPGPWRLDSGTCKTGRLDSGGGFYAENRFAMEFPLAALPTNATVTSASLSIRNILPPAQASLFGYAGDGSIGVADIQVTGTPVVITNATTAREFHDVTSLLTASVISSGWAGFSAREEPLATGDSLAVWECRQTSSEFPILTINFTFN